MEPVTINEIVEAVHGKLLSAGVDGGAVITGVDTDSRAIQEGSLFIPLVGERFDGHAYINTALDSGAAGCLTARDREGYQDGKFYIKVANTQKALWDLARFYRRRFSIPFIAVTGSVGKTTTKDMLAAVLGMKYKVLKTDGNFNNTIGLPLTVLRLNNTHEICVLEMGMNQPGEIEALSSIAEPDVAVITNIGDAHIENLGSRENILKAKCEVFNHMGPDGFAVLNGDDSLLTTLRGTLPCKTVFCGMGDGTDYQAPEVQSDQKNRILCKVKTPREEYDLEIPAMGSHMIYPALMAAAVGDHFGLTKDEIAQGVLRFAPTKMRMNILERKNGVTILNDTYNANPQSMRAAIEVLDTYKNERKIAVLGDMFELGSLAPMLHAGIGDCLNRSGIDCLVAVGELAKYIYDAASCVPERHHCSTKEEAKTVLETLVHESETVLVKASRGMGMEEIVDYLLSVTEEV